MVLQVDADNKLAVLLGVSGSLLGQGIGDSQIADLTLTLILAFAGGFLGYLGRLYAQRLMKKKKDKLNQTPK